MLSVVTLTSKILLWHSNVVELLELLQIVVNIVTV